MEKLFFRGISYLLTIFIWLSFLGFFLEYSKAAESYVPLDFVWQVISLTFVLATLLFTLNNNALNRLQSIVSSLFILSGVFMLFGWGVAFFGDHTSSNLVIRIGAGIFVISMIPLAWGISMLAIQSIQSIFFDYVHTSSR